MEVDMHTSPSPSTFRPMAFSVKRPRSPGSPTQERQTKRLSLAPVSSGLEGRYARRASTALDGVAADGWLANQDDWVRQARELSIASPLSVTVGFPSVVDGSATGTAHSRVDECMAVDDEGSQTLRAQVYSGSSRPWTTTRSHLPLIHITTTPSPPPVSILGGPHAPSPAPFSVLTEPPSSSTDSTSSTSSLSVGQTGVGVDAHAHHPCPPEIYLFPATPSDTPSHQHPFGSPEYGQPVREGEPGPHENGDQSSLTRTQDRTEGSPRPSSVPASSSRKHRVMMGPRADCIKCRTGVRGHWMHFD